MRAWGPVRIRTPRGEVEPCSPRLVAKGVTAPMDCIQSGPPTDGRQGHAPSATGASDGFPDRLRCCSRRPGCWQCLLKGCEGWFAPAHPRCRYCSAACRQAAARWQQWRARQAYRSTERGRACRREQCRRYRQRQKARDSAQRQCAARIEGGAGESPPDAREGQRIPEIPENFEKSPCDRPGCYELFAVRPGSSSRHFCCAACRKALWRVLQREVQRRERRKRRIAPRWRGSRAPRETTRLC
jgi:hypothetical protein